MLSPNLPVATPPEICPSCGASFKSKFCHKCGEKRISAKDFTVRKYARLVAEHFSHFDSKLLRSVWLLVSKPGFLTSEFVAGRQRLYMKPLQLFLVMNLVFFFFFGDNDVFAPKVRYIYKGEMRDWTGRTIKEQTDAYALSENITVETAITDIDQQITTYTKAMLYLMVPILGLLFYGLFFRENPFYLCSLIFATHWFAFLLLFLMAAGILLSVLFHLRGPQILAALLLLLLPHHALALRRFYAQNWWITLLKSLLFLVGFVIIFLFYREFVLFLTFRLI